MREFQCVCVRARGLCVNAASRNILFSFLHSPHHPHAVITLLAFWDLQLTCQRTKNTVCDVIMRVRVATSSVICVKMNLSTKNIIKKKKIQDNTIFYRFFLEIGFSPLSSDYQVS